jgi:hypothetical protein
MIKLTPSIPEDLPLISKWVAADPWHGQSQVHRENVEFWLTGNHAPCLFACKVEDSFGPVLFLRLEDRKENGFARLHIQFAPYEEVDKKRLVRVLLGLIPKIVEFSKANGFKGLVFPSVSPKLIAFAKRCFGFQEVEDDDYKLIFGDK